MSESKPVPFPQLGQPIARSNAAASQVVSAADQYPHLQRNIERPRFASPVPALTPNEVYEKILANAVPRGEMDRTVRTDADVAAAAARSAVREAMADVRPADADAADSGPLKRLERTVQRQGAEIKQLMAKLADLQSTVDGMQGGGT